MILLMGERSNAIWTKFKIIQHEKAKRFLGKEYPIKVIKQHIAIIKDQKVDIETRQEASAFLTLSGELLALEPLISILINKKEPLILRRHIALRLKLLFIDRDQQYQNSIGPLVNILKDQNEDDSIKMSVAKTLAWTRSNEAMQYLIAALKTGNSAVRYGILQAGFEDFKDSRLMTPIIDILFDKTENPNLRSKAAIALGQVGNKDAVEPLICALQNKNKSIHLGAIIGLLWLKHPDSVNTFINILKDKRESIDFRCRAAFAIGEIKDSRAVRPLVDIVRDDTEDDDLREKALESLGKIGDPSGGTHIITLFEKFIGRKHLQYAAIRSVGQIDSSQSIEFLSVLLKNELEDDDLREKAAESIGNSNHPKALGILLTALKDKKAFVRNCAIVGLKYLENPLACKSLFSVLLNRNEDDGNREAAIQNLAIMGEPETITSFLRIVMDKTETASLRRSVLFWLGVIGDNEVIEALISALDDDCERVQKQAAESLLNLLYMRSIRPLWSILREENQPTRKKVMVALKSIKHAWLHPDMQKIRDIKNQILSKKNFRLKKC